MVVPLMHLILRELSNIGGPREKEHVDQPSRGT